MNWDVRLIRNAFLLKYKKRKTGLLEESDSISTCGTVIPLISFHCDIIIEKPESRHLKGLWFQDPVIIMFFQIKAGNLLGFYTIFFFFSGFHFATLSWLCYFGWLVVDRNHFIVQDLQKILFSSALSLFWCVSTSYYSMEKKIHLLCFGAYWILMGDYF